MSFAAPPQPAAPQQRPTTVTIASSLLYVVAAVQLLSAIVSFAIVGPYKEAYAKALQGTGAEGMASGAATVTLVIGAIISLVLVVGYVLLGIFVGKGRNGARITTWVIGGISLCCLGFGTASSSFRTSFQGSGNTNGRSSTDIAKTLQDALPGWYQPTSIGLAAVSFLCVLAVIVLLALPPSHPYFRKQEPLLWQPPAAYPAQPGYPAQAGPAGHPAPMQPGYPAQPEQPGQPGPDPTWQQPAAPQSPAPPNQNPPGPNPPGPNQPDQTDQWKPPSG